jgi:calcium-dependent protein kinase
MLHVTHPNVLKLMEIFEDDKWFFMVMEYMQGGELFEKIVQRGRYSERDAASIFKQIVSGVEYLHNKGIAHRYQAPLFFQASLKYIPICLMLYCA